MDFLYYLFLYQIITTGMLASVFILAILPDVVTKLKRCIWK